jgi:ABC-type antimicrobial peptide transport system permease subunit
MPCLAVLIALMAPRFLIVLLWLFTSWFKGIFGFALWPVLGFLFLPNTLLWYSAVQNWWDGHWGVLQIIGIIIALMMDIGPSRRARKKVEYRERARDDLGRELN